MGNKLYVGNLAYSVRDDSLQQAFGQFGTVTSAKVMMDRDTGRSKGFGFVEMGSDAEAQAAINGMNGQALGVIRDSVAAIAGPLRHPRQQIRQHIHIAIDEKPVLGLTESWHQVPQIRTRTRAKVEHAHPILAGQPIRDGRCQRGRPCRTIRRLAQGQPVR